MREDEKGNKEQSGDGDKDFIPTISGDGSVSEPGNGSMEQVGEQIGSYKLLEVLGEGGYGIVYLAEQQKPIKRQVALKVIKPGMDSKQVIARFEAERQTLALLDHPNIAHVFDAGTTRAGRPYFVMEYVKGISLTNHCDQEKLSIEQRLELFLQVCEAVHYAHQKGIIHRDIKPSNILVSIEADKALPKIIDFGVAKALTQPLTERTFFTEQGQLIGTPEYMSPEQAEMANEDIDTRSDIYSLGVLLYALLTGALPFDRRSLQNAAFAEILRIIREEDPPSPSTRLSSLGEEAEKVAENRRTEIATLARRLHKELEWIPLKAMRKERTHRYQLASELATDIRNYLSGAPLIAGPPSKIYKLMKFLQRNRVTKTSLIFLIAVILVLTGIFRLSQKIIERRQDLTSRFHVIEQLIRTNKVATRELIDKSLEEFPLNPRLLELLFVIDSNDPHSCKDFINRKIKQRDYRTASIYTKEILRRFSDDPNLISLIKEVKVLEREIETELDKMELDREVFDRTIVIPRGEFFLHIKYIVILELLGGLALLLYGMDVVSQGLRQIAGPRIHLIGKSITKKSQLLLPFSLGTIGTAFIRSSTATVLIVVGLVDAGLVTLRQAISAIIGANLGTTATVWLLSIPGVNYLVVYKFTLLDIALGFVILTLGKRQRVKSIGRVLLGFGILFLGIAFMNETLEEWVGVRYLVRDVLSSESNPLMIVLAGTIITALFGGRTCSTSIFCFLAMSGFFGDEWESVLNMSIPYVLGINIGMTVNVQIAALLLSRNAKRAALSHAIFNILGTCIILPFVCIGTFESILEWIMPWSLGRDTIMISIAFANTVFNIITVGFLLPFVGIIDRVLTKIIPIGPNEVVLNKK